MNVIFFLSNLKYVYFIDFFFKLQFTTHNSIIQQIEALEQYRQIRNAIHVNTSSHNGEEQHLQCPEEDLIPSNTIVTPILPQMYLMYIQIINTNYEYHNSSILTFLASDHTLLLEFSIFVSACKILISWSNYPFLFLDLNANKSLMFSSFLKIANSRCLCEIPVFFDFSYRTYVPNLEKI